MKYYTIVCPECETGYGLEFDQESPYSEENPKFCPFCGEEIEVEEPDDEVDDL